MHGAKEPPVAGLCDVGGGGQAAWALPVMWSCARGPQGGTGDGCPDYPPRIRLLWPLDVSEGGSREHPPRAPALTVASSPSTASWKDQWSQGGALALWVPSP